MISRQALKLKECPTEASTEYDDAECRCKPEKIIVSEEIRVAVPEQVVPQPIERAR